MLLLFLFNSFVVFYAWNASDVKRGFIVTSQLVRAIHKRPHLRILRSIVKERYRTTKEGNVCLIILIAGNCSLFSHRSTTRSMLSRSRSPTSGRCCISDIDLGVCVCSLVFHFDLSRLHGFKTNLAVVQIQLSPILHAGG